MSTTFCLKHCTRSKAWNVALLPIWYTAFVELHRYALVRRSRRFCSQLLVVRKMLLLATRPLVLQTLTSVLFCSVLFPCLYCVFIGRSATVPSRAVLDNPHGVHSQVVTTATPRFSSGNSLVYPTATLLFSTVVSPNYDLLLQPTGTGSQECFVESPFQESASVVYRSSTRVIFLHNMQVH